MSAVPGSPKVTRCTSKPASFSRRSSTPSAPASAGVTEGQRTRSRVMETASFIARLNTPNRRRTSLMGHHFDFALLVPRRPRVGPRLRCERVGAKAVALSRTLQAIHFDEAPQAENERGNGDREIGKGIGKPVGKLIVEAGHREERHHPPAALVAIVQPLDGGGEIDPH